MQSAGADSDVVTVGLVPTICDGSVPILIVCDDLVPTVCDGSVPAVDNGLVPMVTCSTGPVTQDSLELAIRGGSRPTGCSAWADNVRSIRADSDVFGVVRALQYSRMWHRMPELGGSAWWSTVSG